MSKKKFWMMQNTPTAAESGDGRVPERTQKEVFLGGKQEFMP